MEHKIRKQGNKAPKKPDPSNQCCHFCSSLPLWGGRARGKGETDAWV